VIALGSEGLLQLATRRYARDEATRNLERKFPTCPPDFEGQLQAILLVPDQPSRPCPSGLAEKDRPIYKAAIGCQANVLLTGDLRDFGFLMNPPERSDGLLIQTVADFLNTFKI
jgi:hypothetical protein